MILITKEGKKIIPLRFGTPEAPEATDSVIGIEEGVKDAQKQHFKITDFIGFEGSFAFPPVRSK